MLLSGSESRKIVFKSNLTREEADIREVVHVFRGGTSTVRKKNNNPNLGLGS